jgi:uncharacterized membrane protein (UPF0127 family)
VASAPLRLSNTTRGTIVAGRVASAGTFWTSFLGLMGRPSIDPDEGLWMPGVTNIHMFFMRFPIDCAFLGPEAPDADRAVVAVRHRLPAWTGVVWHASGARGVVELAPGALERSGTRVGDRVRLEVASIVGSPTFDRR